MCKEFQALEWSLCFVGCFEVKTCISLLFLKRVFLLDVALLWESYEVFVPFAP